MITIGSRIEIGCEPILTLINVGWLHLNGLPFAYGYPCSMLRETIVFYTMQTSASASCQRILTQIDDQQRTLRGLGHECYVQGADFRFAWGELPAHGYLVFANCPKELGPIRDLAGQRFIVNFRDPRDRLCNEFMWKLIHPRYPNEPKEEIDARAATLLELGVDKWLETGIGRGPLSERDNFATFMRNVDQIPAENRHVLTYARLCIDFDSFIAACGDVMGVELTPAMREALEVERTDKLEENPRWIGNQWNGSDVMPGRYKRELKPDTIAFLSEKYADVLRAMARHDPDYAHLYLENVPPERSLRPAAQPATPTSLAAAPIEPAVATANQPFVRHIVIDRSDLRIEHFRSKVRSETVAFTFTDRERRDLADNGFGTTFLLNNGIDVVAIKSSRPLWYENLLASDCAEIERWLSWSELPYRRRVGYGSSMGGYAAARMAVALRFDRVVALSPLFDIKNDWEPRWRDDREAMSADESMFTVPDESTKAAPADQISDHCDYMMIFDPLSQDFEHIRRFLQIIPEDRLKLLPLFYSGHPSGQLLAQFKILGPLITTAMNEGVFLSIADARRRHKAQSPTHLFHLAEHCLRRGHFRWALAINERLIAIKDHPEYYIQAGKILDRLSRFDEALAAIDQALSKEVGSRRHVEGFRANLLTRIKAASSIATPATDHHHPVPATTVGSHR
ncbi:MAG: hypothetical protein JWR77_2506 [Rhizorhabdus sp.]|nr:hypothetical protein [Rhizorhabdus sp.]